MDGAETQSAHAHSADFTRSDGGSIDKVDAGTLREETTLPQELLTEVPSESTRSSNATSQNFVSIHSPNEDSTPGPRVTSVLSDQEVSESFDHRFQSCISPTGSVTAEVDPAFLTPHSPSVTSNVSLGRGDIESQGSDPRNSHPWDVVRWSKLKRISNQTFSESTKRAFGRPTFLTVGSLIAVGTCKGNILLFDYHQSLTSIIGQGTQGKQGEHNEVRSTRWLFGLLFTAVECGAISSLAIAADHSTLAAGHTNGSIFTWDLSRPSKPFLSIPPVARSNDSGRNSDGHTPGNAVLHVGFLGQRHTALVSADDSGMAFSHLASRAFGLVGRHVKTTRILGRYPDLATTQRPSSVLALAPLPLGNVTQMTDDFGITALLTPHLLVVVSTIPVAQTHFKFARAKDVPMNTALTGCLAWFPAVRAKNSSNKQAQATSKTKLVYCWSNVLSLLEVESNAVLDKTEPTTKALELIFKHRGSWNSDEAVVAVQWMNKSMIAALTITQRLIILNDDPLRVADSSDLNSKHIYHHDVFSKRLLPPNIEVDQEQISVHNVIADAYYTSFKAYKGRLFLLGVNEISLGTLSNWADRLMALMEAGNPISAIELATSYYNGGSYGPTLGLPHDDEERHILVKGKILELLDGSLQYLFSDGDHRRSEDYMRSVLQELARVTFAACISIDEVSFLFDEVYDWFSDSSVQDLFHFELEPYIIQRKIDKVPTTIVKDLLIWYASHDLGTRLERILCVLQTDMMDIDQVSSVCMKLQLYDALISVWNRALNDYVAPLVYIMSVSQGLTDDDELGQFERQRRTNSAMKIFPYMVCTLTGRRYPEASDMPPREAIKAKASMYNFILSDKTIEMPHVIRELTRLHDQWEVTSYPYLRSLLRFDSFGFMSMLNEVFEDSFLNGDTYQSTGNGSIEDTLRQPFGTSVTRQRIVNILLEVVNTPDFSLNDTIYLDIFLARNLAKYAQFILLSGSSLRRILVELCNPPSERLAEECQLSAEYLLSVYRPPDLLELVPLFAQAGFFRVLKSTYRSSKQFAQWLEAYFEDPEDKLAVFACIGDCLRPNSGLTKRQIRDVRAVIGEHVSDLAKIDAALAANCFVAYASDMLDTALDSLAQESRTKFIFLKAIMEAQPQELDGGQPAIETFCDNRRDLYVRLMCKYDVQHVADYVSQLESGDLSLDTILPAMEESGAVEAAAIAMTRNGLTREAMRRLLGHLGTLETALVGLLASTNGQSFETSTNDHGISDILEAIKTYVKVGVWICQQASSHAHLSYSPQDQQTEYTLSVGSKHDLNPAELLWVDLIDSIVSMSQTTRAAATRSSTVNPEVRSPENLPASVTEVCQQLVQHAFTRLLSTTSRAVDISEMRQSILSGTHAASSHHVEHVRFIHVLASFMSRLAGRASLISSVRSVLDAVFSTYVFESSLLTLANTLIDKDVFGQVTEAEKKRRFGWRPKGQLCEGCKRRAWGPSAGGVAWEAWKLRMSHDEVQNRRLAMSTDSHDHALGDPSFRKGKSRSAASVPGDQPSDSGARRQEAPTGDALIIFSCMHVFHGRCLDAAANDSGLPQTGPPNDFCCPICR